MQFDPSDEEKKRLRIIRDILVQKTEIPEVSISVALTMIDHWLGLTEYTRDDLEWAERQAIALGIEKGIER